VFINRMGLGRSTALAALGAALLGLGAGGPAGASTPIRALSDDLAFIDSRPSERAAAFREARRVGARVVRITLDWSLVAPNGEAKPLDFDSARPSDRAYRWGYVDDAVRDAAAHHLDVLLVVVRAPAWAQMLGGPDPAELGHFVRAAARRYSGFYPDPKDSGDGLTQKGSSLPAVRLWQVWDRANLGFGTRLYRRMLRASAAALNRVDGSNVVVAGGTTPQRVGRFWRGLRGAQFDIAAHSSLSRLRPVRRNVGRPLWVTDIGRDTRPWSLGGVSRSQQARFLIRALYLADRVRAALFCWKGLQDRNTYLPNFPSIASGLIFNVSDEVRRDPAKPAWRAFHFPFLVRESRAWGIAPRGGGRVAIERRGKRGWRRVRTVRAARSGEFSAGVGRRSGRYRARQRRAKSLPWRR
jgi:hypothetical protein